MWDWKVLTFVVCAFGFFKDLRPSEAYLTAYLTGPWKNFTDTQVSMCVCVCGGGMWVCACVCVCECDLTVPIKTKTNIILDVSSIRDCFKKNRNRH